MVQTWISLCNDKIFSDCMNKSILRIFKNNNAYFYGDYELDIYISSKNDYFNIDDMLKQVIDNGSGWIRCVRLDDTKNYECYSLSDIINKCGTVSDKAIRKMFPRKDNLLIKNALEIRNDGNFIMFACETERFYYVICFATS